MVVNDSKSATNDSKNDSKSRSKVALKYYCKSCDYTTCKTSDWKKHLKTKKHNDSNDSSRIVKSRSKVAESRSKPKKWTCACGKSYKHDSGYYRHKKKCTFIHEEETENVIIVHQEKKELHEMTKEELEKTLLIEQIHTERHKRTQGPENTGNGTVTHANAGAVGNSNIVGNNNNNQFNIQLFLNEDCKNALSIQDFAKQLTVTMEELSLLKDSEPKGIEEIIKNNLMKYALTERPMHNHEKKWYVKDKNEGWEDNKGPNIVKSVKTGISQKSGPVFVDNNPNWLSNDKQGKAYAETMAVAMSEPSDRTTNKVLKSIKTDCEIKKEV